MFGRISILAAASLFACAAHAETFVGTFGDNSEFYVDVASRTTENRVSIIGAKGRMVNKFNVSTPFEVALVCSPRAGLIWAKFQGNTWEMLLSQRTKFEKDMPIFKAYFAIYDMYCPSQ